MFSFRVPSFIWIISYITCLLFILSACSVISGRTSPLTPTPLPTSSIPGLKEIQPEACQVAEQGMIRVEYPQGDLIAWSPISDTLAYVASTLGSSWNVGELNLLTAPLFNTTKRIATQAAGELTWSLDGTSIAYLGLRLSDSLYTIGIAYPDGRPSKDLFPGEAARTDAFSSRKAILEWMDASRLRVLTSCGVDCMQGMDFSIPSGASTPTGNPIQLIWDQWAVHTNHPIPIPTPYSGLTGQSNWSPDKNRIAYIDDSGYVWIINEADGSLYPLDIGPYGTATESDWSFDGRYLALHVDQSLKIYAFQCP